MSQPSNQKRTSRDLAYRSHDDGDDKPTTAVDVHVVPGEQAQVTIVDRGRTYYGTLRDVTDDVERTSGTDKPADTKCTRCDGCGCIANSAEGEPWTAWASLPPGSDLAVRMGIVKPIPCPECGGDEVAP